MSAIYQLKWHGHVATAETLFTICPAAGLKLYHSWLIFRFSLAALQTFLHPVPPRKSICTDYSNESPCPLASRQVPPVGSTHWNQGDGGGRFGYPLPEPSARPQKINCVPLPKPPAPVRWPSPPSYPRKGFSNCLFASCLQVRREDLYCCLRFPYTLPTPLSIAL